MSASFVQQIDFQPKKKQFFISHANLIVVVFITVLECKAGLSI